MPEYSGIYLVENCVAERKRGKIMNLLYKSTRNSEKTVTASEAILKGLAEKETRRRRELKTTHHTRFLSRSYSGRTR